MKRFLTLFIAVGLLQEASTSNFVDSILRNTVTSRESSSNEDFGLPVKSGSSVDARSSSDCSDSLPTVMTTDSGCRKLNQDCSTLQTECSKRLSIAIGNSKNAKKCKKALKTDGQTLVESFCADTCNKCGCKWTEDCPVSTPYCRLSTCYECIADRDCSLQKPYCVANKCIAATTCTQLTNAPFKQRCDGLDGYTAWDTSTWDNGNACIEGCEMRSEPGCCEAHTRLINNAAYCRFYRKGIVVQDAGYADTKATLCSTGDWIIAKPNTNCAAACNEIGLVCSEGELEKHNDEVDSCEELKALIKRLEGLEFASCVGGFGASKDVPVLEPPKSIAFFTSHDRPMSSYSCAHSPSPASKRRLCFCHGQ